MITYLCFGSNIGDRAKNISLALDELNKNGIKCIKVSSLYQTQAVGPKQRDFYNAVGKFTTKLSSVELLKFLKNTEQKLGRVKTYRWGPRKIDIDILFYGKQIVNTPSLIIPHKEIQNRLFVLVPMSEIAPKFVHPILKKTITYLCTNLLKKSVD